MTTSITPLKRTSAAMESESNPNGDIGDISPPSSSSPKRLKPLSQSGASIKNFDPRRYQKEVFEVARKRNTIAVLATGAGKTMIAVMLIQEVSLSLDADDPRKQIVFLAPTVNLVNQQFEVIKTHTDLKVKQYYGALGVDEWDLNCWKTEVKECDVMVMTPQILLDALRKAFITLNVICFLVFDECHRATGNHPYTKIMKEFYHKAVNKPKIFGMTASPVIRKGVSSVVDCEDQISALENLLDSKVYAIEDKTELDICVPSAIEVKRYYDPNAFLYEELKEKMESSCSKFDELLVNKQRSLPSEYKDTEETFKKLRKKLLNYHAKILHCLNGLGLLCAYEAVIVCLENARTSVFTDECELYRTSFVQCKKFLEEILDIFKESLHHDYETFFNIGFDALDAVKKGYISPKLYELTEIFQSFRSKELLCLIFFERIITAKVIQRFMMKVSYLSHLTGSYLTGGGGAVDALTPKMQKETLDSFRCGELNLLFTTDVAEEGIHVANCSCVIRFDLPRTVRSYVQSRGRARQDGSQYIIMLERGNVEQRNMLFDIIRSEHSMTNSTLNRDTDSCVSKVSHLEEQNTYSVGSTGASVTADCSVNLIHKFCEKLPRDMYFTPKPTFQFSLSGGLYECELTLPPCSLLHKIVGPKASSTHMAKQLVCLEACKKLHELGALDDHLLPVVEEHLVEEIKSNKGHPSGAGTTKRKELHGTTTIHALSGSWGGKTDGICLYAYRIDFSCSQVDEFYSGFVLLIEAKLDDEVAKAEVELFLVGKTVMSSVSPCGQLHLSAEQVKNAKVFQELFFNGLFGKLYTGSKSSGIPRQFLFKDENRSLWNSSNMYMLLPLDSSIPDKKCVKVDWERINACAAAVEYVKEHTPLREESFTTRKNDAVEHKSADNIYLANTSVLIDDLKDMVVLALHTGKIYNVFEVRIDMSAESPFDEMHDTQAPSFTSFKDYFKKKYGIVLQFPEQPLLRLKQSHNPHNLLAKPKAQGGMAAEKPLAFVHMPAELLVPINVSISALKSFYLLPSLMHRLESLLLAVQLREEISCDRNICHISSSLILEALTTLRCCEAFSLERLELLGDSVLKYVVSCNLFLKYPKKHEGQLSARRSHAVCNSTLHKLGTNCKLQGYIRDGAFDPRRWLAPGQRSLRPVPCECGVDTFEVPLEKKFITIDTKIVVGKACDRGHRWICSKTISDCAEALIGAYYVGGGLSAACMIMKWLGIDSDFEPALIDNAILNASLWCYTPEVDVLKRLESKIDYTFNMKGLLLEAITHASQQELGMDYCYQRLEFLGDSVLDLLITRYLFQTHTDIDPGELTDLRSASVNNESFAKACIRHDLQHHLQHCSGLLLEQITEYSKFILDHDRSPFRHVKCPKVLGDLVESIAGAILIDTRLDLDSVWRIFKPLLSPIVTPENLELPPYRELNELCSHRGYFITEKCLQMEETVSVELRVQLEDVLLNGEGCDKRKKIARGQAALHLLKGLEDRGISHSRHVSMKDFEMEVDSSHLDMDVDISRKSIWQISSTRFSKTESTGSPLLETSHKIPSITHNSSDIILPVAITVSKKKGAPRSSLFELCKRMQWPMPTFVPTERQSRTPVQLNSDSGSRTCFNIFRSKIKLHVTGLGPIEVTGDERADKKSSQDSAARTLLFELEKLGRCTIIDQ